LISSAFYNTPGVFSLVCGSIQGGVASGNLPASQSGHLAEAFGRIAGSAGFHPIPGGVIALFPRSSCLKEYVESISLVIRTGFGNRFPITMGNRWHQESGPGISLCIYHRDSIPGTLFISVRLFRGRSVDMSFLRLIGGPSWRKVQPVWLRASSKCWWVALDICRTRKAGKDATGI
jgi:hypothetical protein